jgi:hypothetical protein
MLTHTNYIDIGRTGEKQIKCKICGKKDREWNQSPVCSYKCYRKWREKCKRST